MRGRYEGEGNNVKYSIYYRTGSQSREAASRLTGAVCNIIFCNQTALNDINNTTTEISPNL